MKGLLQKLAGLSVIHVLVLGLGAAGIYYATQFDPGTALDQQIITQQQENVTKQAELKRLKTLDSEKQQISNQLNTLRDQLKEIQPYLPQSFNFTELNKILVDEARAVGTKNIRVARIDTPSVLKRPTEDKSFETIGAEVSFEANFFEGMKFLENLTKQSRVFLISKVVVDFRAVAAASDLKGSPILGYTLGIAGYKMTPPTPEENKPQPENTDAQ